MVYIALPYRGHMERVGLDESAGLTQPAVFEHLNFLGELPQQILLEDHHPVYWSINLRAVGVR